MARSARALIGGLLGVLVVVVGLVAAVAPPAAADTASGFRFAAAELEASEDQALVRVVVERSSLPVARAVVSYRSEAVTATEGLDYAEAQGELVFEVGASTASFAVLLLEDEEVELRERLVLRLDDRGTSEALSLSILDNDRMATASSAGEDGVPATGGAGGTPSPSPSPSAPSSASGSGSGEATSSAAAPAALVARPRPVTRTRPAAAPARRRVTVRQSPVTPFELRPVGPEPLPVGAGTAIDPFLAVAAGLLLARVGAELWWRTRVEVP